MADKTINDLDEVVEGDLLGTEELELEKGGLAYKMPLSFIRTQDQKAAMAGTSGSPSSTNKFVTNSDNRLPANEGSAPVLGVRAAVNFDGTTQADVSATYSRTGTTVTVTSNGHGYLVGHRVYCDFTSGTATDGLFTITAVDTNTFTFTHGTSGSTSGNVTLKRKKVNWAFNIHDVIAVDNGQFKIGFNITAALPDAYYIHAGIPQGGATGPATWSYDSSKIKTTVFLEAWCVDAATGGSLAAGDGSNIMILR